MRNPLLKVLPAVALTAGVLAPAAIMTMPTEAKADHYHCGNEFRLAHEHARFHRYEACGKRRDGGSDIPGDENYTGPHSSSSGSSSTGGSSSSSGSDSKSQNSDDAMFSTWCKEKTSRGYANWDHPKCKSLPSAVIQSIAVVGGHGLRIGKCNTVIAVLKNAKQDYQGNHTLPVKVSLGDDNSMDPHNIIASKNVRMPAGGRAVRVQFDRVEIKQKGTERLWASAYGDTPDIGRVGIRKSTPRINIVESCPSKCNIVGSASKIGKSDMGQTEAVQTKISLSNKDGATCPAQTVYLQRQKKGDSRWVSIASKRFAANDRGIQYGTLKDADRPALGTYSYRVHFSVPRKQVHIGTVNFYAKKKGESVQDPNVKGSSVQKGQVQQRGMAKPKPKTVKQQAVSGKKVEQKNKPASSQQQYQGAPQYQQPKTVQPQRSSPYSR
ncbi:MAG: hypothetical protein ACPG1C_06695 [Alphaproteobacteria bacterium]